MNLKEIKQLVRTFESAPDRYRPAPAWWWGGDALQPERLEWQLEQFHAGGVREVMICDLGTYQLGAARSDDPPVFSQGWWDCFLYTAGVAERLGMRIWFWDHLGVYPSDIPEKIMQKHPEFCGRELLRVPAGGALPEGAMVVREDANNLYFTAPVGFNHTIVRPLGIDFYNPAASGAVIDALHGEYERRLGEKFKVIAGTFQDELHPFPSWTEELPEAFRRRTGRNLVDCLPALFESSIHDPAARSAYHLTLAELLEQGFFKPLHRWHEERGLIVVADQFRRARMGDPVDGQRSYHDYLRTHRWINGLGSDHNGDTKVHSSLGHLYDHPQVFLEAFHSSGWGATLEDTLQWLLPWFQQGVTLFGPAIVGYGSFKAGFLELAPPDTGWRQPYWRHYSKFSDTVARLCWLFSQGRHVCNHAVLYPSSSVQAELTIPDSEYEDAREWHRVWVVYMWTPEVPAPTPELKEIADVFWEIVGGVCWRWHGRLYRDDRRPWTGIMEKAGHDFDVLDEDSLHRAEVDGGSLQVAGERYGTLILPRTSHLPRRSLETALELAQSGGRVIFVGRVPSSTAEQGRDDPRLPEMLATLLGPRPKQGYETRQSYKREHPGGGIVHFVPTAEALLPLLQEEKPEVAGETTALHRRLDGLDFYLIVPKQLAPPPPEREGRLWRLMRAGEADELVDKVKNRPPTPERITVTVRQTGSVIQCDPFTGKVHQVKVLSHDEGSTTVEVDLTSAPVGILAFGQDVGQLSAETLPAQPGPKLMELSEVWECEMVQTLNNEHGDYVWPPSEGAPPLEVRCLQYEEGKAGDSAPASEGEVVQEVITGFAPAIEISGPHAKSDLQEDQINDWRPYLFSPRFGALHDIGLYQQHGLKGMVAPEFIAFGFGDPQEHYFIRTRVLVDQAVQAKLRVITSGSVTAWLNGSRVGEADGEICGIVSLRQGENHLFIRIGDRQELSLRGAALRAGFHFLPEDAEPPYGHPLAQVPEWLNLSAPESKVGLSMNVPEGLASKRPAPTVPGLRLDPYTRGRARRGWYRCLVPPGANRLSLTTAPEVRVLEALLDDTPLDLSWSQSGNLPLAEARLPDPDTEGRVLSLKCELPVGLLPGYGFPEPLRFHCGPGKVRTGDWREVGLPTYSGGLCYRQRFTMENKPKGVWLDLGKIRGTVEVSLNGSSCGTRPWSPYRFDLSEAIRSGENTLEATVYNTLGPFFGEGHPALFGYPSQLASGIMGPVVLRAYSETNG
jgi:hypothetical protein